MSSKKKTTDAKDDGKVALVPKLRFPEFRGTEGWAQKRLVDITDRAVKWSFTGGPFGSNLKSSDYVPDGVRIIQLQNIGDGEFLDDYSIFTTAEKADELLSNNIYAGEIIMSKMGDPVGRACLIPEGHDRCVMCSDGIRLVVDEKEYDKYFIYSLINAPLFRDLVEKAATGSTRKRIGLDELKSLPMRLPLKPEQQRIAECLSSVDEMIAAQARKVDALNTHKTSLTQQLFPREGETQPHLRFPEFHNAGKWEQTPLSKLIASLDAGVSVNSGDRPAEPHEVGVLKTSSVTNGVFDPQQNKVVFDEMEVGRVKQPVQADTIIISRMNTPTLVGANAYVEADLKNIFLPDRLWAAKAQPGTVMRFVAFLLGSAKGRAELSKLAKGTSGSMKNITKPEVLALSIMAPSPAEQHRIASCLRSLDALIAAEKQKLEALKRHKRGLMQELLPAPEEADA